MAFKNIKKDINKFKDERILFSLSRNSPLLDFLRSMYSLMLDYGVYISDAEDFEPLIFSKDQLVFLIERGHTDLLLKDLPELEDEGVIRAVKLDEFAEPDKIQALIIERRGVSIGTLAGAFKPDTNEYPEWWTAPIPFAMFGRNKIKLNPAALNEFGGALERLNVAELPEKDEFIVELEGIDLGIGAIAEGAERAERGELGGKDAKNKKAKQKTFFLSFSRLAAGIFTIEDCTGDLVEAQDISWWAGLGRLWVKLIESEGRKWRRLEHDVESCEGKDKGDFDKNNKNNKNIWPCEWQGRFMGYFCIDDVESVKNVKSVENIENKNKEDIKDTKKGKDDKKDDKKKNDKGDKANKDIKGADSDSDNNNVNNNENSENSANNINNNINKNVDNINDINNNGDKINKKIDKNNENNLKDNKNKAEKYEEVEKDEDEENLGLSPQTLGLLAPGLSNYYEELYAAERELGRTPVKRRLKKDFRM